MKKILSLSAKVRRHLLSLCISPYLKKDSPSLFAKTASRAAERYKTKRNTYEYEEFLMPSWKKNTQEIESIFLKGLPFTFLRNQMLKHTMFAHLPKNATDLQKKLLTETYGEKQAKELLHENSAGKPILNDFEYKTSGNSIHHLYHLTKFSRETSIDLSQIKSVLEFGGGYGNCAKIFKKINPGVTYTIIDIPIFSYIQYVYLSVVMGTDQIVMFDDTCQITPGKVNIVPLNKGYMDDLKTILNTPDIFISTWALSETNEATQKMVRALNYFDAKNILLAYQKASDQFAFAQDIENLPEQYSQVYQSETEYLTENFYLFAKKTK